MMRMFLRTKNETPVLRRLALRGATIMSFDARGCMATDHQFQWIGVVVGFEGTAYAGTAARVKIMKRADNHHDIRDEDLGYELEPIDNIALQELNPGLWAIYR